jgi:hypothetical protein
MVLVFFASLRERLYVFVLHHGASSKLSGLNLTGGALAGTGIGCWGKGQFLVMIFLPHTQLGKKQPPLQQDALGSDP